MYPIADSGTGATGTPSTATTTPAKFVWTTGGFTGFFLCNRLAFCVSVSQSPGGPWAMSERLPRSASLPTRSTRDSVGTGEAMGPNAACVAAGGPMGSAETAEGGTPGERGDSGGRAGRGARAGEAALGVPSSEGAGGHTPGVGGGGSPSGIPAPARAGSACRPASPASTRSASNTAPAASG